MDIARRNEALRRYAMSKNEIASESCEAATSLTFGGHLRQLIAEGALESLYEELAKNKFPKSAKEKLLGEIRILEQKLGVEPRPYNSGGAFYGNGSG